MFLWNDISALLYKRLFVPRKKFAVPAGHNRTERTHSSGMMKVVSQVGKCGT